MTFYPFSGSSSGFTNPMTTAGDLIDGGTGGAAQRLAIGSSGQVLTVSGGAPAWEPSSSGFANPMTTAGDLIDATTGGTPQRLGIGTTGQGLQVSGGAPAWENTVNSLTAADTSITVAGTALAPTVATGTLDVIATNHAPAANWSNNSHKITSLANGSASSDAAAFGQIPGGASSVAFHPANPTQTTSTTVKMMGLGATVTFTGSTTGKILVNVSGVLVQNAVLSTLSPRFGTGVAPINGATASGTQFGLPSANTWVGGGEDGFAFTDIVSIGTGTATWFDIALATANASDAASIVNLSFTLVELGW